MNTNQFGVIGLGLIVLIFLFHGGKHNPPTPIELPEIVVTADEPVTPPVAEPVAPPVEPAVEPRPRWWTDPPPIPKARPVQKETGRPKTAPVKKLDCSRVPAIAQFYSRETVEAYARSYGVDEAYVRQIHRCMGSTR